jgi:hypothetical protein
MRLAEIEDIMQVRQIFHANDEKDDEEDGGDVPTNGSRLKKQIRVSSSNGADMFTHRFCRG